jgi:DNA invertase Pin-like site-specific DNA recombinase
MRMQREALAHAGVLTVYTDTASGASVDRPGLDAALAACQAGDTLVAWRLDRLGRSVAHLAELVRDLTARGVTVRTLVDGVDTSSPTGRMLSGILASVAEYEREIIRERVLAGVRSAQAAGVHCGRPRAVTTPRATAARTLLAGGHSLPQAARAIGVSVRTLQRALAVAQ